MKLMSLKTALRMAPALVLWAAPAASAQAPPTNLTAEDYPWDNGEKLILRWDLSADDATNVSEYVIFQSLASVGEFAVAPKFSIIDSVPAGTGESAAVGTGKFEPEVAREMKRGQVRQLGARVDFQAVKDSGEYEFAVSYLFQVVAVDADGNRSAPAELASPIAPIRQWFDASRRWLVVITAIFCGAVIYWIRHARKGRPIMVRKIAGLEAVDEAVGRATEMGRSCLYVPGIQDINDIQTIASMTILSRVSKTAAEYDAKVEVPTARSLVMATARETVQAAYLSAGRPDAYNEDLIYYVTDEQFGYVAYLQGMMVREKPATCFYMGAFYAESLILAETGNSIGAIQIAGTAMPAQLPFFVAACDYTLIGEEFFAASAYLSGSPEEMGSLKGQDVGKVVVAVLLVAGVAMLTVGMYLGESSPVGEWLLSAVEYLKNTMLT